MRRDPVCSELLLSVGYEDGVLELELADGDVYRYFMVPARIYRELLAAKSLGGFFNERIRDRFRFERRSPT